MIACQCRILTGRSVCDIMSAIDSRHHESSDHCNRTPWRPAVRTTRFKIDFVVPAREPKAMDPKWRHQLVREHIDQLRWSFLEGLTHQIGLARDPDYTYPRHHLVETHDQIVKQMTYKRPSPWWYEENGVVYLQLNFGERKWALPGKTPVIRVGTKDDLLPTLEELHILVASGEFDDIIEKMTAVSR